MMYDVLGVLQNQMVVHGARLTTGLGDRSWQTAVVSKLAKPCSSQPVLLVTALHFVFEGGVYHYVSQASLEFRDPLASASQLVGAFFLSVLNPDHLPWR